MQFVLVYNNEKNPRSIDKAPKEMMHDHLDNKAAGTWKIRFGLSAFKNLYFKDVLTLSEEEFNQSTLIDI